MYQRDYLVRLIQEMASIMGKALGLKQKKEKLEILNQWDELMRSRFGLHGDLADKLSAEDIIQLFRQRGNLQVDELQVFALVMAERAELDRPTEDDADDSTHELYIQRLMKSYETLLESLLHGGRIESQTPDGPSGRTLLAQLELKLREYRLADAILERQWRWYHKQGQYAKAENALYEWFARRPIQSRLDAAVTWYHQLQQYSDEDLAAGDLPREEVQAGLSEVLNFPVISANPTNSSDTLTKHTNDDDLK